MHTGRTKPILVPLAVLVAVLCGVLVAPAAHADPAGSGTTTLTAADLPRLSAELAVTTARAEQLATDLEQSTASAAGLRQTAEDLLDARALARAELAAQVRQVYIGAAPAMLDRMLPGWSELAGGGLLATRGTHGAVRSAADLLDTATGQADAAVRLATQAAGSDQALRDQAAGVLDAQDQARALLGEAEQAAAAQAAAARQAAAAAQAATMQAAAAQEAALAAVRASLDAVSASVTQSVRPLLGPGAARANAQQAPVLRALEAAGAGYPVGYIRTGQVLAGTASWYGPGFVGSPTASGVAYDPEQLTCANKELPLDTVVHVSANGRSVNCLVNDRGPYVGDRILDMSRAGSRALGYDGLAQVVVEVLTPG